ncbi:nucleoside-diphosphate sugar epimerase/dehydratase [Larsenimonas suaedae]|uniref:Formyl transferase N-terminal domain-containing protein n=1 Tax=Larsenimonas suaedae TaxID=1851019 RepID=A0ABU1GT97_9GAMM|nr:hypothetical protein [Larsenimonas suaedae]MCM2971679.1 hypothetical protein [Larsenimonas suaedae]MDR5895231.1 hypothetical protein [Larsenimonas suaedae]
MIKRLLNRLKTGPRPAHSTRLRLIICGSDAAHYSLLSALKGRYDVVALITTDPWQRGTTLEGVPLHYPSEVPALWQRFKVDRLVICTQGDQSVIEQATPARSTPFLWAWGSELDTASSESH